MLTIAPSSKAKIPEDCHDIGTLRRGDSLRTHSLKYFLKLNIHFMNIEIGEVTFEIYFSNPLQ